MEMNGYLSKEVNRIKNALADVGCKAIFGVTVDELVQNIVSKHAGVAESADARDLKSRVFDS